VARVLRVVVLAAGVAFMALAFARTANRLHGGAFPGLPRLGVAVALLGLNAALGGLAWGDLVAIDPQHRRPVARGFYLSMLGKYVPGGVWQVVGQVGSAQRTGISLLQASTAWSAFAVVLLASGGAVASFLALAGAGVPGAYRALAGIGLVGLVLLDRRWMVWLVRRLPRRVDAEFVPGQREILRACGKIVIGMFAAGLAYGVLIDGIRAAPLPTASFAWVLSWAVGYVIVFAPAGLGFREAALVALLGGSVGTPALIAASIFHRLATIAAEAIVIVGARVLPVGRRGR
jgi:uncharacterized membrane protein YbhN (UPF0104 family)